MVTVLLAVLAAACNASASVMQRVAAIDVPERQSFRFGMLVSLARRPIWLVGILALTGGFIFQALALHGGSLALVQPVLTAELPLTLAFAGLAFRAHVGWRPMVAAIAMSAGLALILAAAAPSGGKPQVAFAPMLVATVITAGAVAAFIVMALRTAGNARAALLATASGIGFGLTAALIKDATEELNIGVTAMFTSWPVYAMVVAGLISLYLWQNALQAGSLAASQPAIIFSDPIVGIVLGVLLFGEHIRLGWWLAPQLVGAVVVVAASIELARSPLVSGERDDALDRPDRLREASPRIAR